MSTSSFVRAVWSKSGTGAAIIIPPTQQNREFYRPNPKSSPDEIFDTHRLCRCSSLSAAATKNVRSAGGNQYAPIVVDFVRRCRSQHSGGLKCTGCERLSKSLGPAYRRLP